MLVNAGVWVSQNAGKREIFEKRDAKILKTNLEDFCNQAVLTKRQPLAEEGGRGKSREKNVWENPDESGYWTADPILRSALWETWVKQACHSRN